MTYEEALKWLDEHSIGNLEVKETISKALEKQIPKKPLSITMTQYDKYCWVCYNCCKAQITETQEKYCSECGQSILWE